MKQKKYTKRALCMSLLSMLLCCSMLIGTTFAWFTDSVTSGKNRIVAGNLDVELEYAPSTATVTEGKIDESQWKEVTTETNLFKADTLWEPGHTEYVYLRVRNAGSLALKYSLSAAIYGNEEGTSPEAEFTNMEGSNVKLSQFLVFNVKEGTNEVKAREELWLEGAEETAKMGKIKGIGAAGTVLYPKGTEGTDKPSEKVFTLAVYMPTSVDNKANWNGTGTAPTIFLGLNLQAAQVPYESDSFDDQYDKDAAAELISWEELLDEEFEEEIKDKLEDPAPTTKEIEVSSAAELAAIAELAATAEDGMKGWTIKITNDLDLTGANWIPIGGSTAFQGTIDGTKDDGTYAVITGLTMYDEDGMTVGFVNSLQSGTVKNLKFEDVKVTGDSQVGVVVGGAFPNGTVENVTVEHANLTGCHWVGGILGQGYCSIKNCTVKDITIYIEPHLVDSGEYDDGDKAGALAGQVRESGSYEIVGNTVDGAVITGYRDIGGLVGYSYPENIVKNNTVSNVHITVSDKNSYGHSQNAGEILGNRELQEDETGNTATNVTIEWVTTTAEGAKEAIKGAKSGDILVLPAVNLSTSDFASVPENVTLVGAVDENGDPATHVEVAPGTTVRFPKNTVSNIVFTGEKELASFGGKDGEFTIENCDFITSAGGGASSITLVGAGTVRGCNFESNGCRGIGWSYAYGEVLIEDCTFNIPDWQAIHFDGGTGHVTIKNCKITAYLIAIGGNLSGVTMEGCTVDSYVNVYTDWETTGNTFTGKTDFDFKSNGLSFISTNDEYACESVSKGKVFYGGYSNTATILVNGERPTGWIDGEH